MPPSINTAICLLIKDENDYVNEWLDWHVSLGFEHFYIYDNGSQIPISDTVNKVYKPYCTFIDFSGDHKNTQMDCYNDVFIKYGKSIKWLAFIDTDEFIRTIDGSNINDFLSDYEECDGLYIRWIMYNANGLWKKDSRPQRERFTKVSSHILRKPCGKSILRPERVHSVGVHFPDCRIGEYNIVDSNKKLMKWALSDFSEDDKIVIDHYFTRSYEEWQEKAKRGSCDPRCERKYDEFFLYNQEMEESTPNKLKEVIQ